MSTIQRAGPRWAESICILFPARLALAALFGLAGFLKLQNPQSFALSLKAFAIFDVQEQSHIIKMLVFGIPWTELIIAACLLLGLWTRSAALLLMLMLLGFTAGIANLMIGKHDISCSCFGKLEFLCSGPVGPCHLLRNSGLILLSLLLVWRGGGKIALDQRSAPAPKVDSQDQDA